MAVCNCIVCLFGKWHTSSETIHAILWFLPASDFDNWFWKVCLQCATSNVNKCELCSYRAAALTLVLTLWINPEPIWTSTLVSMLAFTLTLGMKRATEINVFLSSDNATSTLKLGVSTALLKGVVYTFSTTFTTFRISKENFNFTLSFISC